MKAIMRTVCCLTFATAGALSLDAASAPPPGPLCQKEPAKEAFSTGMEDYGRRHYREAIPDLSDAARLCPKPGEPWSVYVHGFGEYPYLPYYYLGKSYYRVQDRTGALRHLYLSACFGEPSRDEDFQIDLHALTRQCQDELASPRRPDQLPDFGDGFAALDQKRWEEAAEKMWNALQIWEEDGRTTYSAGRWPDPYLPRFQLAEALFKLGCEREACEQLDQSRLRDLALPQAVQERRLLDQHTPICAQKKREPYRDTPVCERWRCWLKKGSAK
jgi:hypothetical protein